MVGKILKGSSAFGCANYCLDHDEAQILASRGLDIDIDEAVALANSDGQERKRLARMMARAIDTSFMMQASANPAVERPVGHIPLCFMKEDEPMLTNPMLVQIAQEYLRRMGYLETQYMVVRHFNAKGNPHIHIFFNRVDDNGVVLNAWQDYRRNASVCRALTEKYGLHLSSGRSRTIVSDLRGREYVRYTISNAIDRALPSCHSWKELGRALMKEDIMMELVRRNDGSVQGVRFGARGKDCGRLYEFSGSKVGRKYSYLSIDRILTAGVSCEQKQSVANSATDAISGAIGIALSSIGESDEKQERDDMALEESKRRLKRRRM